MTEYVSIDLKPIKPHREMTVFHCQELLYDYICGQLTDNYKNLVERSLKENEENQSYLRSIQYGMHYCKELAQTEISNDVYDSVSTAYGLLPSGLDWLRWKHWPHSLRWSSEALLVSLSVALAVTLVPWKHMWKAMIVSDQKVVLSEVVREKAKSGQEHPLAQALSSTDSEISETSPSGSVVSTTSSTSATETVLEQPSSVSTKGIHPETEVSAKKPMTEQRKGYVYRGFMRLKGLDQLTLEIVMAIERLGGIKAGSVPLGWRKTKGSYFHFAMEEERYEELLSLLKKHGEIRIYRDEHVRVMPEGQIRIILWIEESVKAEIHSDSTSSESQSSESQKENPLPTYRDGEETPIESEGEPLHE